MSASKSASSLRLAFYGDDLTGSTDALESVTLSGVRAVLFVDPPSKRTLQAYPGLEAIGVAGMTRAMGPAEMERTLAPAFAALCALKPRHFHYKVCSTFDSSPRLGSIGRALDVGARGFGGPFVPIVGGAPALGRYCAFGNLFARMGIGSAGGIFRLDRHPSMSRHPATPATESDLRIALSRQTRRQIALFDFLGLDAPLEAGRRRLADLVEGGAEAVLFDALTDAHVTRIGELLEPYAKGARPLFTIGPSSVELALAGGRSVSLGVGGGGFGGKRDRAGPSGGPVLVASGSGSVVTRRQIARAIGDGFVDVRMGAGDETKAAEAIRRGRNVILRAGRIHPGPRFGWELGRCARAVLESAAPGCIVLAGGDSSSHAARALGIESLEMIARLTPGAPLCRARAPGSPADGAAIVFKGGQVGGEDYFSFIASTQVRTNRVRS